MVAPAITQRDRRRADRGLEHLAAMRARLAAHFEHVGEIGVEAIAQRQRHRVIGEAPDLEPLEARTVVQNLAAQEMDLVARELQAAIVNIGIGEIDREHGVVARHARAQEQGPRALDHQDEAREIARVLVEQPFGRRAGRLHVAIGVEHRERVALLQALRADPRRGAGRDVERPDRDVGVIGSAASLRSRPGHRGSGPAQAGSRLGCAAPASER